MGYTEDDATIVFHGFTMIMYSMCIFGGILSDGRLGKFRTLLYLSIVYLFGSTVLSISSIPTLNFSPEINMFVGLALIGIGGGGIKLSVCAFGGDQFKPEQAALIATYFSMVYLTANAGSLISTTVSPILRADVHCFGQHDCFPLAFGLPAVLMLVSVGDFYFNSSKENRLFHILSLHFAVLFFFGKPFYTFENKSSKNMLVQVLKCITVLKSD